jgi:hypothetical protein
MSELGQTETSARLPGMSGLSPIADVVRLHDQLRSVPTSEVTVISQSDICSR